VTVRVSPGENVTGQAADDRPTQEGKLNRQCAVEDGSIGFKFCVSQHDLCFVLYSVHCTARAEHDFAYQNMICALYCIVYIVLLAQNMLCTVQCTLYCSCRTWFSVSHDLCSVLYSLHCTARAEHDFGYHNMICALYCTVYSVLYAHNMKSMLFVNRSWDARN
jgi:hypothetical protein